MTYHGSGIYAPNEGDVEPGRILDIINAGGGNGAVVLLDHQMHKDDALRKLREGSPGALIQIRRFMEDWTSEDWRTAAHRFVEVMERARAWTVHGTWANEQNLAAESKGKVGAAHGRLATWADYRLIHEFNYQVAAEVRRIAPWIVLHYPGMAYGHGEDWGYDVQRNPMPGFPVGRVQLSDGRWVGVDGEPVPAYRLLEPGIRLCHVLNVHPYVQNGAPVLDEWSGVRRVEKVINLLPGMPLFAAETGDFDVWHPHAPDRILEIAYYLQGLPHDQMLGWCFFILNSPDPGHAMNNWSNNRKIEEAYQRMTRVPRALVIPTPGPVATPPAPAPTPAPPQPKPQEPPVSDLAHPNNYGGVRPRTRQIIVHTTRSGRTGAWTLAQEFSATVDWFQNPAARVSAHVVVGPDRWATTVPFDRIAYGAAEHNDDALHIEIVQPTPATVVPDRVYELAAAPIRQWAATYGIPLVRVHDSRHPGLIGHEDTDQGKRVGKTDPSGGGGFSWEKLLDAIGGDVPNTELGELRDRTWGLANQLRAVARDWEKAHPWHAAGLAGLSDAIKALVTLGKGER